MIIGNTANALLTCMQIWCRMQEWFWNGHVRCSEESQKSVRV